MTTNILNFIAADHYGEYGPGYTFYRGSCPNCKCMARSLVRDANAESRVKLDGGRPCPILGCGHFIPMKPETYHVGSD